MAQVVTHTELDVEKFYVNHPNVTLNLTAEEVAMLFVLLRNVGGLKKTTLRKYADDILQAVSDTPDLITAIAHAFGYHDFDEFVNLDSEIEGSVYFIKEYDSLS